MRVSSMRFWSSLMGALRWMGSVLFSQQGTPRAPGVTLPNAAWLFTKIHKRFTAMCRVRARSAQFGFDAGLGVFHSPHPHHSLDVRHRPSKTPIDADRANGAILIACPSAHCLGAAVHVVRAGRGPHCGTGHRLKRCELLRLRSTLVGFVAVACDVVCHLHGRKKTRRRTLRAENKKPAGFLGRASRGAVAG